MPFRRLVFGDPSSPGPDMLRGLSWGLGMRVPCSVKLPCKSLYWYLRKSASPFPKPETLNPKSLRKPKPLKPPFYVSWKNMKFYCMTLRISSEKTHYSMALQNLASLCRGAMSSGGGPRWVSLAKQPGNQLWGLGLYRSPSLQKKKP